MAEAHPPISATGLYLRSQAFITRYLGTLGGLILSLLGVAAAVWIFKKATAATVALLQRAVKVLISVVNLAANPAAAIMSYFNMKTEHDAADYVEPLSPDVLLLTLQSGLPGPVTLLTNTFVAVLEGASSALPGSTAPILTPGGAALTTPALTPGVVPTSNVNVNAPPVTATGNVIPSEIQTGLAIYNTLAETGTLSWLGGAIADLFSDAEYRDSSATYRDATENRARVQALAIASAASSMGIEPQKLFELARQLRQPIARKLGFRFEESDEELDHGGRLSEIRNAATTTW
jgi:hypothetical protein